MSQLNHRYVIPMRVHYLQHVPFEGLGSIQSWLEDRGHTISVTRLHHDEPLPLTNNFDWLIVMGGPMGVGDTDDYPWLTQEKAFIKQAIDEKKIVLGICLGAQLIADVLGANITPNSYREIGWHPIELSKQAKASPLGALLPSSFDVFHWHGETFDIPDNAIPLASSEACQNQGFVIDQRIIGLQFHLETTPTSALDLTKHCNNELDNSRYVQTAEEILGNPKHFEQVNNIMAVILGYLEKIDARKLGQ